MNPARKSLGGLSGTQTLHHYLENALAKNSRTAYRNDLRHFLAWGADFPATPEQIASYLSYHGASLSIATLQRRLVGIAKAHTMQGHNNPVDNELVKMTFRGIRRLHGKPQSQAAPILKEDLIIMLSYAPKGAKGLRDRALLLLGFCSALRRSELVAIKIEDIQHTAQGIVLMIPRSKTDQYGIGRKIGIPKGRGRVCPVTAVHDWLMTLSASNGPLFRSVGKGGSIGEQALSDRAVSDIIKVYVERAGLNPARYSGHSLRAGLCTSAAHHGISSWKIRQQTGHRSDAMLSRYVREGDLFLDNAAALF